MIKVTLGNIVNSMDVFNMLMQQPFKGSLAFNIARLARELNKEITTFNDERTKIITNYGEKDDNGEVITNENGTVTIPPEKIEACNKELTDLIETEVEINANKITMDRIDDFDLTPEQILTIEPFFDIPED